MFTIEMKTKHRNLMDEKINMNGINSHGREKKAT